MLESYEELYRYAELIGGLPWAPRNAVEMGLFRRCCPTLMRHIGQKFAEVRDSLIQAPDLRQVVTILSAYITDDAGQLSFANMLPLFGYYFRGGRYPRGGSQALADALAGILEEGGGRLWLRTPVNRILVRAGRAYGVRLHNGDQVVAGRVVSNADLIQTLRGLVGLSDLPGRLSDVAVALRPSNSGFMVYLALDYDPPLASSTLIMSGHEGVILSRPPFQESRVPTGYTTLTLTRLVPALEAPAWDRSSPNYKRRKREAGDRLIELASSRLPELANHIVYREDASPATFRRYCWTSDGAAYGATPDTRWPNHCTPIGNLYVVGASTGLGPGIEAVMVGAASLAEQLQACTAGDNVPDHQFSEVPHG